MNIKRHDLDYGTAILSDVHSTTDYSFKNGTGTYYFFTLAPLFDIFTNERIGTIMNYIDLSELNAVLSGDRQLELGALTSTAGRRETLEILLINSDGFIITNSRFFDSAPLSIEATREPANNCKSNIEIAGSFKDYRNIEVFGSSMCLQNGWTLVAKIDKSEALEGLISLQRKMMMITLIVLLVVILFAYRLSRGITKPIINLSHTADLIAEGNIDAKVEETKRKDEIGSLARSFSKMTDELRGLYKGMEQKIEEKTKALRESEEQYSSLIENINIGIFRNTGGPDGKFIHANPELAKMFGYESVEEVMNVPVSGLYQNPKERQRYIDKISKQGFVKDEVLALKKKDGTPIWAAVNAHVTYDDEGNILWMDGALKDITEQKLVDKAKSEFISLASHQLRTPLTAIRWGIGMLRKKSKFNETSNQIADEIHGASVSMSDTIQMMLQLSRVEAGKIELNMEEVNICPIIEELISEDNPLMEAKNQACVLTCTSDIPRIITDRHLLQEILRNLLSNAIKYTLDNSTIEIFVETIETNVRISVKDNGIGIPKNEQKKIFSKFFRASNALNEMPDGTGLGLYLVHSLVRLLGGTVEFESIENEGSTFTVSLPVNPPDNDK